MATIKTTQITEADKTADPSWRAMAQARLLLQSLGLDRHHPSELCFLALLQQHLSLLTTATPVTEQTAPSRSGVTSSFPFKNTSVTQSAPTPTISANLSTWGPNTIDAVSIAFVNNRGLSLWGLIEAGRPSHMDRYQKTLTLFLHFLISLILPSSPETSTLIDETRPLAITIDVCDPNFYKLMVKALVMLAKYPDTVMVTKRSHLVDDSIRTLVLRAAPTQATLFAKIDRPTQNIRLGHAAGDLSKPQELNTGHDSSYENPKLGSNTHAEPIFEKFTRPMLGSVPSGIAGLPMYSSTEATNYTYRPANHDFTASGKPVYQSPRFPTPMAFKYPVLKPEKAGYQPSDSPYRQHLPQPVFGHGGLRVPKKLSQLSNFASTKAPVRKGSNVPDWLKQLQESDEGDK